MKRIWRDIISILWLSGAIMAVYWNIDFLVNIFYFLYTFLGVILIILSVPPIMLWVFSPDREVFKSQRDEFGELFAEWDHFDSFMRFAGVLFCAANGWFVASALLMTGLLGVMMMKLLMD